MSWFDDLHAPSGQVTVIGCGSRAWKHCDQIALTLEPLRCRYPLLCVVEGGANGADLCVALWASGARVRGVHWIHIPARWDEYGPSAGHRRNRVMVDQLVDAREREHGVAVVAFKGSLDSRLFGDRPHQATGGTEDCIRRAWAADLPVWWQRGDGPPTVCLPAARLL